MKSYKVRLRAFAIWQKLGYNPWEKPKETRRKASGDFYKGAFSSIPFLNDDAKRTFRHLLLRPGYMIRDYIKGAHEQYLAPLTALIVFYAFFALIWSVMQPVQKEDSLADKIMITMNDEDVSLEWNGTEVGEKGNALFLNTLQLLKRGLTYLTLDQHPEEVHTRGEQALAALEGTLRSQGIPLFIGQFFLLWMAMSIALRRYNPGMSATAAATAYILCQYSFFMLFAVLLTLGQSKSVSSLLMLALLTVDLRQWLGLGWKKGFKLAFWTSVLYGLLFLAVIFTVGAVLALVAWRQGG